MNMKSIYMRFILQMMYTDMYVYLNYSWLSPRAQWRWHSRYIMWEIFVYRSVNNSNIVFNFICE